MDASTPSKPAFKPFVPATESRPELTARALILGAFFGVVFGAVTVYVGLRAGLTVAASIPIAVLSITILRAFGRASILENNIVQTTGNAGQSIASGVIFTLPALVFLGYDLEASRIFALALFGGWLGVLFMIPLRRQLIVEEHGTLLYPEGTACADVLIAGERGGSFASRVFLGLGLGGLYTLFQNDNLFGLWPATPKRDFDLGPQHLLKGASIRADCTPEYLGVGYIIGARVAAIMFAGGVFSWLVVMPAIHFFGSGLTHPLYPSTSLIRDMSPSDLWSAYVRPMGAGAVAASGLITSGPHPAHDLQRADPGPQEERSKACGGAVFAHRSRYASQRRLWRQRSADRPYVPLSPVQARTRSLRWPSGEPCRRAADRRLRLSLRHCLVAHRRHCGFVGVSGLGNDHRNADGHLGDLPGEGMDRRLRLARSPSPSAGSSASPRPTRATPART